MRAERNEIRVVLFDVGGVLVELSGLPMLLSWLGHRVTAEQARTLWLTSPVVRSFETGKMQPAVFAARMITELSLRVGSEQFLSELYIRSQRILPGAVELVRRVPRSYIRATLCNTNALHWPTSSTYWLRWTARVQRRCFWTIASLMLQRQRESG